MQFGVHFVSWGRYFDPKELEAFFRQVKETGSDVVEIRPLTGIFAVEQASGKTLREIAAEYEISLTCCLGFPPGLDLTSDNPFVRSYAVEHLKRAVEATRNVGADAIGGILYTLWPADYAKAVITPTYRKELLERSLTSVCDVLQTASDYDVYLDLEITNRFENCLLNTVSEGLHYIRETKSDHCRLLLDTFHLSIEEDDLEAAYRLAGKKLGRVHATEPNRGIPYHEKRIPWTALGQTLQDIGFDGPVIIEAALANDGAASQNLRMWRGLLPDDALQTRIAAMRDGVTYLRNQFTNPTTN